MNEPQRSQPAASAPPPGWHPDPHTPGFQRYWDGERWTSHTVRTAPTIGGGLSVPSEIWWALASAGAVIVGTFMPWARIFIGSVSGLDADRGLLVLGCGVISVVVLVFARQAAFLLGLVLGAIALAVCIWFAADVASAGSSELFGEEIEIATTGIGVWVSAAGSASLIASLIVARRAGAL